jgi:hypothetical protein
MVDTEINKMSTELHDNATHEEIEAFVDQAVKDIEADRSGDNVPTANDQNRDIVPDAARIVDDNNIPVTERDAAAEAGSADWRDDDFKAMITAYGMDETAFSDFASRDEAERAIRLLDKRAQEMGREELAKGSSKDEKGHFAKEESQEENETPGDGFRVTLDSNVFHEDLVSGLEKLQEHYEERFRILESRFEEADVRAESEKYDQYIDALDYPELFGVTGNETPEELNRRRDLVVAAQAYHLGLERLGHSVPLDKSLFERAARMAFTDELAKKDWKAKTRKVSRGSNLRMGGGQTRPTDPTESLLQWAEREYARREST